MQSIEIKRLTRLNLYRVTLQESENENENEKKVIFSADLKIEWNKEIHRRPTAELMDLTLGEEKITSSVSQEEIIKIMERKAAHYLSLHMGIRLVPKREIAT